MNNDNADRTGQAAHTLTALRASLDLVQQRLEAVHAGTLKGDPSADEGRISALNYALEMVAPICNSHAALVEALEEIAREKRPEGNGMVPTRGAEIARAALQLAKEGQQ